MVIELESLADLNPKGYVLNAVGGLGSRAGNVVHRANCWLIPRMDLETPKYWADTVAELHKMLQAHGGDFDKNRGLCLLCRP